MASIFTKIINGDIPCYKISETDDFLAFLDINPNAKGHTLCRKVAIAIEKTIDCKRVGMSVIGLEVPHVHVHLIPLNSMEDARFTSKESLTKEEFEAIAKAIKSNL